jgi:hypothetical protein
MFHRSLQIISTVLFFLVAANVYAATGPETTVTCKVYNNTGSAVFLYKVENGEAVSLGFRRPGVMDTCMFSFPMEKEGVYFIQKAGPHMPAFKYVIYLKPGDNKSVDIYASRIALDFDSCKVQNPSAETVCLQNWTNLFNDVFKLGLNRGRRDEYIAAYGKLIEQAKELKRKTPPINRYFKRIFGLKLDADLQYLRAAAFFQFGERMNAGLDTSAKRRQFYQPMAIQRFCTAGVLESEHGLILLKYNMGYQLFQKYGTQEQMLAASFLDKIKMICNDTVRAAYASDRMQQITNYEQFKIDIQPLKRLFATTALKQAYQKKEDELTVYAKGASLQFFLKDTKIKQFWSDFKGKVVKYWIWRCVLPPGGKPLFQN